MNDLTEDVLLQITQYLNIRDYVRFFVSSKKIREHISMENEYAISSKFIERLSGDIIENVLLRLDCFHEKNGFKLLALFHTNRKCCRSGCYNEFTEVRNLSTSCRYHPGKRNPRTKLISCCRAKSFLEPGCTSGFHNGMCYAAIFSKRYKETYKSSEVLPPIADNEILEKKICGETELRPTLIRIAFPKI